MNRSRFIRLSQGFAAMLAPFLIYSSASATPTGVLEANCIWSGDDGSLIRQSCRLVGNSSAGSGTGFYITWEDGMVTKIWDLRNSGNHLSLPSGESAQLYGEYEFRRMLFPRQITIQGKGTISVIYDD